MRVRFSQPTTEFFDTENVSDIIRKRDDGVQILVQGEVATLVTSSGLVVEGNVRADTKHGGKISFTLSHHAMSEVTRDWALFEGRAICWTGLALSFSHLTGLRNESFKNRVSSDALVSVDVAIPGSHVAGILGQVHEPVDGEISIVDGAITHVSQYTDPASLLDIHAGGDSFAWVHISGNWSDFRLSDEVVTGVYDFYRNATLEKRVTLHATSGTFFFNDVQQSLVDRVLELEGIVQALTGNV